MAGKTNSKKMFLFGKPLPETASFVVDLAG
jgi:hypothetical protein